MGCNSFIKSISNKNKGVAVMKVLLLILFSMFIYANPQAAILAYEPVNAALPEFYFIKLNILKHTMFYPY